MLFTPFILVLFLTERPKDPQKHLCPPPPPDAPDGHEAATRDLTALGSKPYPLPHLRGRLRRHPLGFRDCALTVTSLDPRPPAERPKDPQKHLCPPPPPHAPDGHEAATRDL